MFRYDELGSRDDGGRARFALYFPGPDSYVRGGDPKIATLHVYGTFQTELAHEAWCERDALPLLPRPFEGGVLFEAATGPLRPGFYEYKFLVRFANGDLRKVSDPCARYGGGDHENSGFVIGGTQPADNQITVLADRASPGDLVIYELFIDDFTAQYRGGRAPVDAVIDKLDYISELGFNAVEFLPWTAWPTNDFSWGYIPHQYFAVEHRYVDAAGEPSEKLSLLKRLISECHQRGLHVIMDGVFNHVERGAPWRGFAYYWLYQNPADSPFIGPFEEGGYGDDLDFANDCTEQFIGDVCRYWIDIFAIDGLRLDFTKGFYRRSNEGLATIIATLRAHLAAKDPVLRDRFPIVIEHLQGYAAIEVANRVDATGCWYDEMFWRTKDFLSHGVDNRLVRLLDAGRDFGPDRRPVTYLTNHDHSEVANLTGGRESWYRIQPYLIALFTVCGAPLLYQGAEFGDDHWIPEGAEETTERPRVVPRPKRWEMADDAIGRSLRRLVTTLAGLRAEHPALRSTNFYRGHWEEWMRKPDLDGYGLDLDKATMVFHRWGSRADGQLERFIVALNFSPVTQTIDIPLPNGGIWEDLISGWRVAPPDGLALRNQPVGSNWGHVFYKRG